MTHPTLDPTARRHKRTALILTATVVFGLDIGTKVAASIVLADRDIDLPGPLDLRLSHNSGVAFGLGNTAPAWLILTLTGVFAIAIGIAAWRGHFPSTIAAGVVIGGALANVADRSEAGTVVDMLHTGWWPTFNVADIAIVCGALALAITDWRAAPHESADTP